MSKIQSIQNEIRDTFMLNHRTKLLCNKFEHSFISSKEKPGSRFEAGTFELLCHIVSNYGFVTRRLWLRIAMEHFAISLWKITEIMRNSFILNWLSWVWSHNKRQLIALLMHYRSTILKIESQQHFCLHLNTEIKE